MHITFGLFVNYRTRVVRRVARALARLRIIHFHHGALKRAETTGFPEGNVLIVAPHPDDEVFACGGLIAYKINAGEKVDVLFMTKGEMSYETENHSIVSQISETRFKTAYQALRLLGVDERNIHWFNYKDKGIPDESASDFSRCAQAIADKILELGPDLLFVPHLHDFHQDHINTNKLVTEAYKNNPSLRCVAVYCYSVYMLYNLLLKDVFRRHDGELKKIDISEQIDMKKEAIRAYMMPKIKINGQEMSAAGNLSSAFMSNFEKPYELYFKL